MKRTNAFASAAILMWYLVGATNGWKGWGSQNLEVVKSSFGAGGPSGGHGWIHHGGWGGGK